MSPFRLIVIFSFICHSAMSQTTVVKDSCTGNLTSYSRINDSLYAVDVYFRNQPIFKGYLYFPSLDEHYDPSNTDHYDEEYNRTTQTGRCTTWLNNGSLSSIAHYQPLKKETEKWTYAGKTLEKHELYRTSYYLVEQYDANGKLLSSSLNDYRSGYGKRTIIERINGKLEKSIFIEDPSNGNFYPKNGVVKTYSSAGAIVKEDYYFKKSSRIWKSVYYDEENIHIYETDEEGNEIFVETKDKISHKTTYLRKTQILKDANGFVYDYIKWEEYDTKDTSLIIRRSLKDSSIYAFRYHNDYKIWFKNGLFCADVFFRDTFDPYDLLEYRQKGKHLFVKAWKNGDVKLIRHVAYPDFQSNFQYFPNSIKEFEYRLSYFDYTFSEYTFKYQIEDPDEEESDETHYLCHFTDSFFNNNKLTELHFFHDDTTIYYTFKNGIKKLAFHSHYLKPIKDINQCATGMKNHKGEWTIPARFDEIRPIFRDTSLLYFCLAGDYTSVYTWDGRLVLAPVKDMIVPGQYDGSYDYIWKLSKSLTDSLHLSSNIILQIRNEFTRKHQFINLKNELLMSLPYRMYVESDFREDGLDNMLFNLSDSLGRSGFIDLKGQYFPCIYSLLDPLKNGDRLMRLDSSKDIYIITPEHQILNIPPFADYMRVKNNDSLIVIMWHDSSFSIYNIYNRQAPVENHHYKMFTREDYNGLYHANYKGKSGIIDRYLQTVIPFKYTHIYITGQDYYMCRNADTTDFYTPFGKLAHQIVCDSIYHRYNYDFDYHGYPFQVNNYYYRTGRYNSSYWLSFSKNGKFGLINMGGKILSDKLYDKIATSTFASYFIFFQGSTISSGSLEADTILIKNHFPAETYLYYENIINSADNGIINYKGETIVTEINSVNTPVSRYGNASVIKNDKLYGIINIMGEWVLKTDRYQRCDISQRGGTAYVTNNEGKAGVIDCSGKEIVEPLHQVISYEPRYDILWHTDLLNPASSFSRWDIHNIWKISKQDKTLNDTLDYPTEFVNGFTLVKNRYNFLGIIDSALNVHHGFRFKSYNNIHYNQHYIFKDSTGWSWLMDKNFQKIKIFKSDKANLLNDSVMMVFNGNMSYTMKFSGEVIDSSINFFTEFPKSTFSTYWNDEDNLEDRLSDMEEEYYEDREETEETERVSDETSMQDTCSDAQINFIKIVNLYMDAYESESYYMSPIFPMPDVNYNDNYYVDYPVVNNGVAFNYNILGFGTFAEYEPWRMSLSQLQNYPSLYIDGHSGRLLNYIYNMGRDYNNDLYTNFYFSDNNIIYEFNLSDLIDPSKSTEFNNLVIKTLERLELQHIPCYKSPDFIALLNDKMKASKDGIELKVESDISIQISYEELKPMMREFWKEKLME
ncbi:MAG: hypothetical protein ACKOXF_05020 [Chitinophagaceae bacterium]